VVADDGEGKGGEDVGEMLIKGGGRPPKPDRDSASKGRRSGVGVEKIQLRGHGGNLKGNVPPTIGERKGDRSRE